MIWTGKREFLLAQAQVCVILAIAYIGNTWPHSYPRNDNHNPHMFWIMNICLGIAALFTFQHDVNGSARGVQLLSRNQTEEWKGWMQFAFIMYHYYRAYFVYNEIRVFVSAVSYYNVGNSEYMHVLVIVGILVAFFSRPASVSFCLFVTDCRTMQFFSNIFHLLLLFYIVCLDDGLWQFPLL
jgi:hypothetical protein